MMIRPIASGTDDPLRVISEHRHKPIYSSGEGVLYDYFLNVMSAAIYFRGGFEFLYTEYSVHTL